MENELTQRIATAYIEMVHSPNCELTKQAYAQFCREVEIQFNTLPVEVEWTGEDLYKTSAEMFADVQNNETLKIYSGGTPHELVGQSVNLKFRAVHYYFGHYVNRNSFSGTGEYRAYVQHSKMFSKLANLALFTETLGQNAVYNTTQNFAEQKAGVIFHQFEKDFS
jgi:hypothetical protein